MDAHPLPIMRHIHSFLVRNEFIIAHESRHPLIMRIVPPYPRKMDAAFVVYNKETGEDESILESFFNDLEENFKRYLTVFQDVPKTRYIEILFVPSEEALAVSYGADRSWLRIDLTKFDKERDMELVRLFFSKQLGPDGLELNLVEGFYAPPALIYELIAISAPTVNMISIEFPINVRSLVMELMAIPFPRLHDIDVDDENNNTTPLYFTREEYDWIIEWLLQDVPQMTSFLRGIHFNDNYLVRQLKKQVDKHCLVNVGPYTFKQNKRIYENLNPDDWKNSRRRLLGWIRILSEPHMRAWRALMDPKIVDILRNEDDLKFSDKSYEALVSHYFAKTGSKMPDIEEPRVYGGRGYYWYAPREEPVDLAKDLSKLDILSSDRCFSCGCKIVKE